MRKHHFSMSLLLLFVVVLVCGCKKDPKEEPPKPDKGSINASVPKELSTLSFTYCLYDSNNALLIGKDAVEGFKEQLPIGGYNLYTVGFNAQEAKVVKTNSPKEVSLVVNKQENSLRILPLTGGVYLAEASAITVSGGEITSIELIPRNVMRYLDIEVSLGIGFSGLPVKAILSGISDSLVLSTGKSVAESSKELIFDLTESTVSKGIYTAKVGILGIGNKPVDGYKLELEIDKSGVLCYCSSDVGSQIIAGNELVTIPIRSTMSPTLPIRLYTSIETPSRSHIDNFNGHDVGIAVGALSGNYTDHWVGKATNNEIELSPKRFYPIDGSNVHLVGFYPFTVPDASGNVNYNLTGSEDIMWAGEQSGSFDKPFSEATSSLKYNHMLSMFIFKMEIAATNKLYYLRELKLSGLSDKVTLSLVSGVATYGANTVTNQLYVAGTGVGLPITNGVLNLPNNLLVQPSADIKAEITLSIDNDRNHDILFKDIPVTVQGGSASGSAYEITITIPDPEPEPNQTTDVKVTAKVINWSIGAGGGAEIKPEKVPNQI